MNSSLIGKIEKAKRYAQERNRVTLSNFTATFHGEHDDYSLGFKEGKWHCSCNFFTGWETCSHTMAVEKILGDILPKEEPLTAKLG